MALNRRESNIRVFLFNIDLDLKPNITPDQFLYRLVDKKLIIC